METIEKIYKEIKKLYDADDNLFEILERSERDSETQYKEKYLNLFEDIGYLRKGLHELLDLHNDVIMDIEYALEPLPVKNSIANHMANEAIGVAQRTGRAIWEMNEINLK